MDLIFNRNRLASDEFKDLLGFVDADLNFNRLRPFLMSATHEIIKIIGNEVYNTVFDIYDTGDPSGNDANLLYYVQYAIVTDAYRKYAPSGDLAHTNKGRLMRSDDHEKSAFEWMIDRDNENLDRLHYRAMDHLIDYLDNYVEAWQTSVAFQRSHALFVRTTDDFDTYFPMNSRYLLLKLQPGLKQCETMHILPRIGEEQFNAIKTRLQQGETLTEENTTLLPLIQEACAYWSISWAMRRLTVTLFPDGVLQRYVSDQTTTQGKRPAVKYETEQVAQQLQADAKAIFTQIEALMTTTTVVTEPAETEEGTIAYNFNFDEDSNYIST